MEAENQTVVWVGPEGNKELNLAEIEAGMLVRVAPGQCIPVDGVVHEGQSQAEEALLTGEPKPITKTIGDTVYASSLNGDGALVIKATAAGLESRWIEICRDVRIALSQPTSLQRLAERAAIIFVPVVIAMAILAAVLNWQSGMEEMALMSALAVLVVACPCALGLAAPLATSLAITKLSAKGILIRSGSALERLANIRTIALDKTGTLTAGYIQISDIIGDGETSKSVLQHSILAATGSLHPLSKAIGKAAQERGIEIESVRKIDIDPGRGIRSICKEEAMWVGSRRWFEQEGLQISHKLRELEEAASTRGQMLTRVAWQGRVRDLILFHDNEHPGAEKLIQALEARDLAPVILTGDGPQQAGKFCRSIGAKCWLAGMTPQQKLQTVK